MRRRTRRPFTRSSSFVPCAICVVCGTLTRTQFTALLGSSVLWDIYFVFKLESVLARLTLLALTVFKACLSTLGSLRTNARPYAVAHLPRIRDIDAPTWCALLRHWPRRRRDRYTVCTLPALVADDTGRTVWSMPGGFTSGGNDGYQPVGDARPPPPPVSRAPAPAAPAAQAGHGNAPVPGAYQAV
jgi:hypothetical protein